MASLYNHSELEARHLPLVRGECCIQAWERTAPRDLLVNYGFDAMNLTALFFNAGDGFRWKEEYEDQIYGFYLMLSRIWEIAAEQADRVLDNTVTERCDRMAGAETKAAQWDMAEVLREEAERIRQRKRFRHNAVIALLMQYSHRIRRIYHQEGQVEDTLLLAYATELKTYAPCLGRELIEMWKGEHRE